MKIRFDKGLLNGKTSEVIRKKSVDRLFPFKCNVGKAVMNFIKEHILFVRVFSSCFALHFVLFLYRIATEKFDLPPLGVRCSLYRPSFQNYFVFHGI